MPIVALQSPMPHPNSLLTDGRPKTVGSFGKLKELLAADPQTVGKSCDLAEVRLDLIASEFNIGDTPPWLHLHDTPLLFTARRIEEGGALALEPAERAAMVHAALDHAALVDIEVASIPEMPDLIKTLRIRDIPWIASFHDFGKLPGDGTLAKAGRLAKESGAAAFKVAAMLHSPADIAALADFQSADHGLPVASMGMGPLASVSRLLCAQCGSILNYGYLGNSPTAPGQWDAAMLKQAIAALAPFSANKI